MWSSAGIWKAETVVILEVMEEASLSEVSGRPEFSSSSPAKERGCVWEAGDTVEDGSADDAAERRPSRSVCRGYIAAGNRKSGASIGRRDAIKQSS